MAPRLSVVVPTLAGDASTTIASLGSQTVTDWELIVVTGVRPAGRARNEGIARSSASLLLFLDDDAKLGDEHVLERMLSALAPGVGVVGSSKLVPPEATRFQRRVGREVPGWTHPVRETVEAADPPLHRYGFTPATTTCCLIPRDVIDDVGAFDERLPTGEDTELFFRIRSRGYRLVIAPCAWTWHAPPATVRALVRKSYWYGVGHAHEALLHPGRRMRLRRIVVDGLRRKLGRRPHRGAGGSAAVLERRARVRGPLSVIALLASAAGYAAGRLGHGR